MTDRVAMVEPGRGVADAFTFSARALVRAELFWPIPFLIMHIFDTLIRSHGIQMYSCSNLSDALGRAVLQRSAIETVHLLRVSSFDLLCRSGDRLHNIHSGDQSWQH